MNCKQIMKHMDEYQSGKLDRVLIELIEKHLASCPECRKAMDARRSVSRFLKTADSAAPGVSVVDDVLKKIDALDREERTLTDPEIERFRENRTKWLMVAALFLGILLIGLLVIPFDSRPDQHHVGHSSGPGYTWLGDMPMTEPMESRWYDPELSGGDRGRQDAGTGEAHRETPAEPGRITHVLELGGSSGPADEKEEDRP